MEEILKEDPSQTSDGVGDESLAAGLSSRFSLWFQQENILKKGSESQGKSTGGRLRGDNPARHRRTSLSVIYFCPNKLLKKLSSANATDKRVS